MFEDGLVIVENKEVTGVMLSSKKSSHSIHLNLEDFRYICLWTKEGAQVPFLCLEPFAGLPDVADQEVELMEKEANTKLMAGQSKAFEYTITLK